MNKIFYFSIITLFLSSFNLHSKIDISNLVKNFKEAKDCEKTREEKKGCEKLKKSSAYLKDITRLVTKGEITKDEYNIDEFKLVINTLSEKGRRLRFPRNELFPIDQKTNIFKYLLEKDLTETKIDKVKSLFEIAKKIDDENESRRTNNENEENDENYDEIEQKQYAEIDKLNIINEIDEYKKYVENQEEERDFIEQEIKEVDKKMTKEKDKQILEGLEETKKEFQKEKEIIENNIKKLIEEITEKIKDLEKINKNLENKTLRITNVRKLFTSRVQNKKDSSCFNILHFAIANKNVQLVDFLLDKNEKMHRAREKTLKRQNRKISRYTNTKTFNWRRLADAQERYALENPDDEKDYGYCFPGSNNVKRSKLKEFLVRQGIISDDKLKEKEAHIKRMQNPQEYSALELNYLFTNEKPKETLEIAYKLIKKGARYKEDLIDARNKRDKTIKNRPPRRERKEYKFYSTIFKDFILMGGINNYKEEKKDILKALTTNFFGTRTKDRELKERFESLLDQAIEYNSKYWCETVLEISKEDPFEKNFSYKYPTPYYAYFTKQEINDREYRKEQRAKGWQNFTKTNLLPKRIGGKIRTGAIYPLGNAGWKAANRHLNKVKEEIYKTPLDAAWDTECQGVILKDINIFMKHLYNNFLDDLYRWKKGERVHSYFHHKAFQTKTWKSNIIKDTRDKLFEIYEQQKADKTKHFSWLKTKFDYEKDPKLQDQDYEFFGLKTNKEKSEYNKKIKWFNIVVDEIVEFIMNAKDELGNTPWDYGTKKNRIWTDYSGDKNDKAEVAKYLSAYLQRI
jgi:hypothetical protein